jgi:hypothetical protein
MDCAGRSSRFQKVGMRPLEETRGICRRAVQL